MIQTILTRIRNLERDVRLASLQSRSEYTGGIARLLVADLPTSGQAGQLFWVSNGRKSGEGVGAGTGVIAFWNNATSQWLRVEDNAVVQA
jgi:hypothetical protein